MSTTYYKSLIFTIRYNSEKSLEGKKEVKREMGNCMAGGKAEVHSINTPPLKGEERGCIAAQMKVRMSIREFKEIVSDAESRKCDAGALIMEGIRKGKWRDVHYGAELSSRNRRCTRILGTINEY